MASSRSSQVDLYASEDLVDDAYRVRFENKQAEFKFSGAQSMKMDFPQYNFAGATQPEDFELVARFAAIEGDSASIDNAAAIVLLQQADAAEATARASADTILSNSIAAEISRASTAEVAVDVKVDSETQSRIAADGVVQANLDAEAAARVSAVASEAQSRAADVSALQSQISNLLANTDAVALNSLAELVAAYEAGDSSLAVQAAGILTRLAAAEAVINDLVNAGL
jgi:hypothetical protein